MTYTLPPHTAKVLELFGFPDGADAHGFLWWTTYNDGTIKLFAQVNDLFSFALSDVEPIEEEDIALLEQCLEDLRLIDAKEYLPELFASRKRNLRPHEYWMNDFALKSDLYQLFDGLPYEQN